MRRRSAVLGVPRKVRRSLVAVGTCLVAIGGCSCASANSSGVAIQNQVTIPAISQGVVGQSASTPACALATPTQVAALLGTGAASVSGGSTPQDNGTTCSYGSQVTDELTVSFSGK
jgi:hypothetical protein